MYFLETDLCRAYSGSDSPYDAGPLGGDVVPEVLDLVPELGHPENVEKRRQSTSDRGIG